MAQNSTTVQNISGKKWEDGDLEGQINLQKNNHRQRKISLPWARRFAFRSNSLPLSDSWRQSQKQKVNRLQRQSVSCEEHFPSYPIWSENSPSDENLPAEGIVHKLQLQHECQSEGIVSREGFPAGEIHCRRRKIGITCYTYHSSGSSSESLNGDDTQRYGQVLYHRAHSYPSDPSVSLKRKISRRLSHSVEHGLISKNHTKNWHFDQDSSYNNSDNEYISMADIFARTSPKVSTVEKLNIEGYTGKVMSMVGFKLRRKLSAPDLSLQIPHSYSSQKLKALFMRRRSNIITNDTAQETVNLTSSVSDCGVNVHENSCKDQIAQCSKFRKVRRLICFFFICYAKVWSMLTVSTGKATSSSLEFQICG